MPASPSLTSFVIIYLCLSLWSRSLARPKRWPRQDSCHGAELVSRNEVVYQPHVRWLSRFDEIIVPTGDSQRSGAAFRAPRAARQLTVRSCERWLATPRRNRKGL